MQEMLHALDHRRPVRFLGNVNDAFHSQQVGAEVLLQGVEQEAQRLARNRLPRTKQNEAMSRSYRP